MTDKKTFGSFIKTRRVEKNYSQKDLAQLLFVTEGAVSKWERGVSYPDITLISDICRVLDISEHELITASTDTETRKMKRDAKKFKTISAAWFWVPTVSYIITLIVCFICNLSIDHKLSWFFIVAAALVCAFTFVPTVVYFFESKKLLVFCVSTYLSIALLLFVCAVYTNGLSWFLTACIGVLIGYELLFLPVLMSKTKLSRYRFLISFTAAFLLTIALLLNIYIWHSFMLKESLLVTTFAFLPVILCAFICTLRLDAFIKAAVCTALCGVWYFFTEYVVDFLFGGQTANYKVDFTDWKNCAEGNVYLIFIVTMLVLSIVFVTVSVIRKRKTTEI